MPWPAYIAMAIFFAMVGLLFYLPAVRWYDEIQAWRYDRYIRRTCPHPDHLRWENHFGFYCGECFTDIRSETPQVDEV